ncbi:OLC1v1034808C1 [Oldenlandia corymbosa var. corymbosa]|uniref:OLC1v1034808C1 n=1 Tax=Oldenlandia corymbosa var. corymbosa TaxID=529605 RepID=A0AAV1CU41_OLDCO|nr:OLC1v1034808C1 [Oldenlandia corymbosa var. corymbosa]
MGKEKVIRVEDMANVLDEDDMTKGGKVRTSDDEPYFQAVSRCVFLYRFEKLADRFDWDHDEVSTTNVDPWTAEDKLGFEAHRADVNKLVEYPEGLDWKTISGISNSIHHLCQGTDAQGPFDDSESEGEEAKEDQVPPSLKEQQVVSASADPSKNQKRKRGPMDSSQNLKKNPIIPESEKIQSTLPPITPVTPLAFQNPLASDEPPSGDSFLRYLASKGHALCSLDAFSRRIWHLEAENQFAAKHLKENTQRLNNATSEGSSRRKKHRTILAKYADEEGDGKTSAIRLRLRDLNLDTLPVREEISKIAPLVSSLSDIKNVKRLPSKLFAMLKGVITPPRSPAGPDDPPKVIVAASVNTGGSDGNGTRNEKESTHDEIEKKEGGESPHPGDRSYGASSHPGGRSYGGNPHTPGSWFDGNVPCIQVKIPDPFHDPMKYPYFAAIGETLMGFPVDRSVGRSSDLEEQLKETLALIQTDDKGILLQRIEDLEWTVEDLREQLVQTEDY